MSTAGREYRTGVDVSVKMALKGGTAVEMDIVTVSETTNSTVETFYLLKDGGYASNVVTAVNPTYSLTIKFDKKNAQVKELVEAGKAVLEKRYVQFIYENKATGETINETEAVLTDVSANYTATEVIEVSMSVAFQGKPTGITIMQAKAELNKLGDSKA